MSRRNIGNKLSVEFTHGRIIRCRKRRFVVVDCTEFEAIIAREVGKRRLERIAVAEAQPERQEANADLRDKFRFRGARSRA